MSRKIVWSIVHDFEDDTFCDHFKIIGIFRTREQARAVVRRLKEKPGFVDHQKGFFVDNRTLNYGEWAEGFVTMIGTNEMPEPEIPTDLATALDFEIEESQDGLWYVLHSYLDEWNCTETKDIGLYSDLELARNAVRDRLDQPGFRSRPNGFQIIPMTLGRIAYEGGF